MRNGGNPYCIANQQTIHTLEIHPHM